MFRRFLIAQWRDLAMLNYEIDPALLADRVPRGVELDFHQGRTFVSVVGFRFLGTRVLGIPIPFHRNFEEVNLRFYVRRQGPDGWRRGVTFVRELVPRRAIAFVARAVYNEPYLAVPMRHSVTSKSVQYQWKTAGRWASLRLGRLAEPAEIRRGSHEEFITEHYWGYCAQRDGGTVEYQVEHPRWRVWNATHFGLEGDLESLYGPELAEVLRAPPVSAFVADGSAVAVLRPRRLPLNSSAAES